MKKKVADAEREAADKARRERQKKGDDSPTRSPKPGQRVPIKQPEKAIIQVKPVEEQKDEKKKPEMKDA
jgi:hypothetical protein